ncbi:DUF4365 domain-containing protein [Roseburia hominis]|uniref:DUF4365 domain-containing protein n=1 Tax=Roseburia hominis TaxID=301301 RepID=UPI0022E191EC|nr:DUF4365 domain-containing protein [Roseburia hominis]
MDETHIKEELSVSYVKAVSASAGMTCDIRDRDYGIDGSINDIVYRSSRKRYTESGFAIDFQLKSTVTAEIVNNKVVYDLEVKNYKDLIERNVGRQRILILYVLPEEENQWVSISSEKTVLKKCAYWCSLRGLQDVNNSARVRIKIPDSQLLTRDELIRIMNIVKKGEVIWANI